MLVESLCLQGEEHLQPVASTSGTSDSLKSGCMPLCGFSYTSATCTAGAGRGSRGSPAPQRFCAGFSYTSATSVRAAGRLDARTRLRKETTKPSDSMCIFSKPVYIIAKLTGDEGKHAHRPKIKARMLRSKTNFYSGVSAELRRPWCSALTSTGTHGASPEPATGGGGGVLSRASYGSWDWRGLHRQCKGEGQINPLHGWGQQRVLPLLNSVLD